jgi:hypothetical protein
MSNAGMSGFVSFLEHPFSVQASEVPEAQTGAVTGAVGAAAAISQSHPAGRLIDDEKRPAVPLRRQGKIRKAVMVEDGHSLAEQAVYEAMWLAADPVDDLPDADRTIRIGYHRLGQMARLSWVSVKSNLRTLESKLAIEVTGSENSATREGKCYLVYSRSSILDRRKGAGLEWVRRTRGVELLSQATIALGRPGPKPVA